MNYEEVISYIERSAKFGIKPGLERTERLLKLLGDPHRKLKCIHIAGTNGKGSTTAMIANILKCADYKVGTYISPELNRMTERMTINGREISKANFAFYGSKVITCMEEMTALGLEEPTQFEMMTAMAFLYFESQEVNFAVIEVGLGGAYDATNVIKALISVITSISMDHMEVLGDTIEQIAREKAGIIKKDRTTVLYPQLYPEASEIIEETCKRKKAKLVKVDAEAIVSKAYNESGQVFDYCASDICLKDINLSLLGDHQLKNAAVALTAINELSELGYNISEQNIRYGLETVVWPCRLSLVTRRPLILIDGAHNPDGVDSLKAALQKYFNNKRIIFIMGTFRDKDYKYTVSQLMPLAYAAVATEPVNNRALKTADMADNLRELCANVSAEPDIEKAIEKAVSIYQDGDLICICGSLSMAGTAFGIIKEKKLMQ